jgi:hypothetical protein
MRQTAVVGSSLLVLALAVEAQAGLITPGGLAPGAEFRIVFVTDSLTRGTSNSLAHYDGIVGREASAAGLTTYNGSPVIWRGIVSTDSVSAISRLPADSVPLFLPDGTRVASSGAALWSTGFGTRLQHQINENASGVVVGGTYTKSVFGIDVWTGTGWNGKTQSVNNVLVGLGDRRSFWGSSTSVGMGWSAGGFGSTRSEFPIYGFSSVLFAETPEPASLTLALGCIGGFLGLLLVRRLVGS